MAPSQIAVNLNVQICKTSSHFIEADGRVEVNGIADPLENNKRRVVFQEEEKKTVSVQLRDISERVSLDL